VTDVKKITKEIYSGDFDFPVRFRFAVYISEKLHKDYDLISATFSAIEKKTLEKYIIDYRIEKIKEFLVYSSQTLSDMAFRLGFSSVAHLSRQFKTVTGFNPSWYRSLKETKK
jgi:AraC-like DNA-binding protein